MSKRLRVDMVSDVVCPWCAVGLYSLLQAQEVFEGVALDLHFHPFELSPNLPPEGELVEPHLMKKYGMTSEQVLHNQQQITARGKEVGFDFDFNPTSMKWNTLDAHRLLHWAQVLGEEAQALKLKQALLVATFSENQNIADANVLAGLRRRLDWISRPLWHCWLLTVTWMRSSNRNCIGSNWVFNQCPPLCLSNSIWSVAAKHPSAFVK